MMGESTFEFSVNEYSWQPKVIMWFTNKVFLYVWLKIFFLGSKVFAAEELEPYLRLLHGKIILFPNLFPKFDIFNCLTINYHWHLFQIQRFVLLVSQGGRTVRYAIYVNGQEVENGTEPSTGGTIQGLPAGFIFKIFSLFPK